MAAPAAKNTCPHPIAHCDICRSREACAKRCRDDDHLSLVVGISKLQINELTAHGVVTVQGLATMPLPLDWKPDRSSADSYIRIREQAQVVVEARAAARASSNCCRWRPAPTAMCFSTSGAIPSSASMASYIFSVIC